MPDVYTRVENRLRHDWELRKEAAVMNISGSKGFGPQLSEAVRYVVDAVLEEAQKEPRSA